MKQLSIQDQRHLEAAEAWLDLGNALEANEELEMITPQMRAHPDVLAIRFNVYAAAGKWEMAAEIAKALTNLVPESPFGWIHLAYALHELNRTREAWNVLLPVVDKFPEEYVIRYNLACYACRLGNLKEARDWLQKTIELADMKEVKLMALDDPDLEPLWEQIGEL